MNNPTDRPLPAIREPVGAEVVANPPATTEPAVSPDLNALRDRFVDAQAHRLSGLVVDPEGRILLAEQAADVPARQLSHVTTETFYAPDLNRIAENIRHSQARNTADPKNPSRQLFVDNNGDILFGDQVAPGEARRLSRVTQETFFSPTSRQLEERRIVADKLPPDTAFASDGTVSGWLYQVTTEFDDRFDLFLWFDAASATYRVSLVEPRLGGRVGVEDCHLYPDGTLCLKRSGGPGYAKLEDAYARSVVWTRGASCYLRGHGFQFNIGQES